jgi:hypothetical protein
VVVVLRIRNATATEAPALEALQRRSSDVWEEYREQLAANPDAIELPQAFIDKGWVRVAVDIHETQVGFSVVVPTSGVRARTRRVVRRARSDVLRRRASAG